MLIKCMFYDDDGTPRDGGCRKPACTFVHPQSPNWSQAVRKHLSKPSWRASNVPSSSSSSFHPDWDTSSWVPSGSNHLPLRGRGYFDKSKGEPQDVPPATSTWGQSSTSPSMYRQVASPSHSGWGTGTTNHSSGNTAGGTSEWGSSGSEKGNTNGWGSSGNGTNDTSGWGSSGSTTVNASGWGSSTADSGWGWGETTIQNTKRKGKEKEATASSVSIDQDSFWTAAATTSKQSEDANTGFELKTAPLAPPASEQTKTSKAVEADPEPLEPAFNDATPVATPVIPFANPPTDWSKVQTAQSTESAMKTSSTGRGAIDPCDYLPSQLYSLQIFHIQRLVRFYLEAATMARNVERWKRTQSSFAYTRAHLWIRTVLSTIHTGNKSKLAELQKKIEVTKKQISDIPQLSPAEGYTHMDIRRIQDTLRDYKVELVEWVQNLELHRRIPATPAPESITAEESPWEKLKATISDLETHLDAASEELYSQRFTHVLDNEGPIDDLFAQHAPFETEDSRVSRLGTIKSELDKTGGNLEAQTQLTNMLLEKIHNNEQILVTLRAEREEQKKVQQQVEAAFARFEAQQEDDRKEIERLTDQVKKLAESPSHSKRRDEFDVVQLVPILTTQIVDEFVQSLVPSLKILTQHSATYNQQVSDMLNQKLGPLLQHSEMIRQHLHAGSLQSQGP